MDPVTELVEHSNHGNVLLVRTSSLAAMSDVSMWPPLMI